MTPKKQLLKSLYQQLNKLLAILESLVLMIKDDDEMALDKSVQDVLTAVDVASSAIAAVIQKLVDELKAGAPLTPEAKAAFQVEIDKLNALGKDPVIVP